MRPATFSTGTVATGVGDSLKLTNRSEQAMTMSSLSLLLLESAAAEPTSAANSTSAAAAGSAAAAAAAAAEQQPDQRDGWGSRRRRRGHGRRAPAQPGLQPQPGASQQETTHRAFRR